MSDLRKLVHKSIPDLLKRLDEKGMTLDNEEECIEYLNHFGYTSLIMFYRDPFYDIQKKRYLPNTRLLNVVQLYEFDRKLRHDTISIILDFENRFKNHLADALSITYGTKLSDYCDFSSAVSTSESNKLKSAVDVSLQKTPEYIKRYVDKNAEIPPWFTVHAIQLSTSIQWYHSLPQSTQIMISRHFNLLPEVLYTILLSFQKVRNICAHNWSLFSARYVDQRSKNLREYSTFGIPKHPVTNRYQVGINDYLSVLLSIRKTTDGDVFSQYFDSLDRNLLHLKEQISSYSFQVVLTKMGLSLVFGTESWERIRK